MIRELLAPLRSYLTIGFSLVISTSLIAETFEVKEKSKTESRPLTAEERAEAKPYDGHTDLTSLLKKQTIEFMVKMRDLQASNPDLGNMFSESRPEDYERVLNRMNFLYEKETVRVNKTSDITANLTKQTSRTATEKFKDSNPLYQKFKAGFAFDLSLESAKSFFSKSSAPTTATAVPTRYVSPAFKYGLIVQDIIPEKAKDRASTDSFDELAYAKKARVKYTIGKLTEDESSSIKPVPLSYDLPDQSIGQSESSFAFFHSAWDQIHLPRPDFGVKIEPGVDPTSAATGAQISPNKLTGGLVLEQKDGLYRYRRVIGQNFLTPEQIEKYPTHELRIPAVRTLAIARSYNTDKRPIQSSVYGILVSEDLPLVNVHYLELEERYKAELVIVKNAATIKGNIEMRQGWKPGQPTRQEGDKVTVEFTTPL